MLLAAHDSHRQGGVAGVLRRLISDLSWPSPDEPASPPEAPVLDRMTELVYRRLLQTVRDGRRTILAVPVEVTIGLSARDHATLAAAGLGDASRLGRHILHMLRIQAIDEIVLSAPEGLTIHTEVDEAVRSGRPRWRAPVQRRRYRKLAVLAAWRDDEERAADRELGLEPGDLVVYRHLLEEIGCSLDDQVSSSRHAVVEVLPDETVELRPATSYLTYVNDIRVRQPVTLHEHDRVRFGNTELAFRYLWTFGPVEPWPTANR